MTLDQLNYFLVASVHEHIGRAGKALRLNPSTISQAISRLEDEFGIALFAKRGKRIVLTHAGKALAVRAKDLLDQSRSLQEEFSSSAFDFTGTFSLAGTHGLCQEMLVPAWVDVSLQFPRIKGEIFSMRSAQIIEGVLSGIFDAGVCYSPLENLVLQQNHLYRGQLLPAVQKGHPLATATPGKAVASLSQFPVVAAKSFQGVEVCETHPMLKVFGVESPVALLYDSYETAVKYVERTSAWSLLPDWVIEKNMHRVTALSVPRKWDAPYSISLVSDGRRHQSRVITELQVRLKQYARV